MLPHGCVSPRLTPTTIHVLQAGPGSYRFMHTTRPQRPGCIALALLCQMPQGHASCALLSAGPCAGLPRVQRLWRDIFDHFVFDVWLTPTTPVPATLINETEPYTFLNGRLITHEDAACRFNHIDPPIAVPSISVPAGMTASGLPIGLQLQARPGEQRPRAW